MSSLKEIKSRIASIQNTQKITSAMGMVANAKLLHAEVMMDNFLRYKDALEQIVQTLGTPASPLSEDGGNQGNGRLLLIPISSNSGLCGAYNSNITRATLQRLQQLEAQGTTVRLLPIGRKIAHDLHSRGLDCNIGYYNLLDKIEKNGTFAEVTFLVEFILQLQQSGEIDRVEFLHHHFRSMGSQVITTDRLPLTDSQPRLTDAPITRPTDWLTEPSPRQLLQSLTPRLLNAQAYGILLDTLTSEHAARMLAMQTAEDNADQLLKQLRLLYNKTRQQAITNELIDIMGGQIQKQ